MKKRFLLLYPFLVIGFFIISVTCTYGQRGGRGGFSRGGFGGSGFSSGFSRNFGGGYNRSFGGNIYNVQNSRINRNMAIGRIGIGAGMGTTLYRSLPSSYQRIKFRGVRYYFYDGLFFDYYGGYYRSIFPPIGLTIASLPYGYWGFNYGGFPYFYHTGIYYQQHENNYQVVDAPVGASVPQLPKDAKVVVINNENYFEYNGTYYKEYLKQDGSKWYLIAGLHGVLNTTPEVTISSVKQLHVGDVIDVLPNDCKVVVIDNKKYYVSSDNIYFEEFIENNVLKYKVVGK
jgi:hypothetical protein